MIYLLLSIASSTAIFVLFKLFKTYTINTLHAIVFNYLTAALCGVLFSEQNIDVITIINSSWIYAAIILGFLFISIFNIMALTAQKNGLSAVSVSSKMSVIIPVLFGIIVYNESVGFLKIFGIVLALTAVLLTSIKPKDNTALNPYIYLPIILFLGSGIIDTSVNHFAPQGNIPLFLTLIFSVAGTLGIVLSIFNAIINKTGFKSKAIPFGIALGVVNYGSMYFLLKALRVNGFESSTIFTINNVAIVAASCLIGLLLFKERITKQNWIGIITAVTSIVLVTL
ncbi:EamA/RhaT family transporter [uncultured Winogradskyella sp.]|uniref:EamA/RhaT family transporter n=1 Tax=uncultured Winogradskyella sp. TaxID=395353 RepID=UPI002632830B|nr:EamA/RhaT family transporter [uncultured Winogradskyella sp.]